MLICTNDPLWEVTMRLFGFKKEDQFWFQTLESLASHFGVQGYPQLSSTCADPNMQWSRARNIWHNAAIRSAMHAPLRMTRKVIGKA